MRWLRRLALGLLLWPTLAVADVPIDYVAQVEPRYPGLAALGPTAVAGFTGNDGKAFAAALRGELQSAEVDSRAYYTVRNLDDTHGPIDTPVTAVHAGAAGGVTTVFTGVADLTIVTTDYKQDRKQCTESGILHCAKNETVAVPCTRYNGTYVVTPSVYRVADSKLFYTETVTVQADFSTCAEAAAVSGLDKVLAAMTAAAKKDVPVTSREQLVARLRTNAADEVRSHLTPTTKKIKVVFKDTARDLAKADQDSFRSAAQFARAKRLDRACGIFETLETPDKANNVALLYNLGVCQEALEPDRPADALKYYNKADQRTTTPDRLVSDAVLRMRAQVDAMPKAK